MFKGVPTLANLNLRLLSSHTAKSRACPGRVVQCRSKATATSLDLNDANGKCSQIDVDVYSEQDLLKRAKFRHRGLDVQQKIASEVSGQGFCSRNGNS